MKNEKIAFIPLGVVGPGSLQVPICTATWCSRDWGLLFNIRASVCSRFAKPKTFLCSSGVFMPCNLNWKISAAGIRASTRKFWSCGKSPQTRQNRFSDASLNRSQVAWYVHLQYACTLKWNASKGLTRYEACNKHISWLVDVDTDFWECMPCWKNTPNAKPW